MHGQSRDTHRCSHTLRQDCTHSDVYTSIIFANRKAEACQLSCENSTEEQLLQWGMHLNSINCKGQAEESRRSQGRLEWNMCSRFLHTHADGAAALPNGDSIVACAQPVLVQTLVNNPVYIHPTNTSRTVACQVAR
jgi:hypothetical protein